MLGDEVEACLLPVEKSNGKTGRVDRDVRHSSSGKGAPTILYLNKEEDEPRSRERWGVREPLILQDGSRVTGLVEDAHCCFSSTSHLHPR